MIWKGKNAYVSPVLLDEWEYLDDGESAGEVHWLRRSGPDEPLLSAGLWRHLPEEHPHGLPYRVKGSESIYVIDGMAELILPDGSILWLQEGYLASFGDGFEATWKTKEPFTKFFVVTE